VGMGNWARMPRTMINFANELELLGSDENRGRRGGHRRRGVLTTRAASSCTSSCLSVTTKVVAWRRA
jgi:hypothetical protein